jgi:prophage regulatory protein
MGATRSTPPRAVGLHRSETHMDTETTPIPNHRARRGDGPRTSPLEIADRIIREPECERISGLSRSTRWRLERGGDFPKRRRISAGCSGWLASELAAWVARRAAK